MTFRDRVEASPVGWLLGVGAGGFLAGVLVTLSVMQVVISDRDRLYSLRRGDLVEISGVLKFVENTLVIEGDDFDVVTAPTLTPTPRTKK